MAFSRADKAEELFRRGYNCSQSVFAAFADAVGMIQASYAYACQGILPLDELRARLGNRSYLSALDAEDPRNMAVPSLRPPAD